MTDNQTNEFEAAFLEAARGEAELEAPQDTVETDPEAANAEDQTGADQPPADDPEEANPTDIWLNATPEQRAAFEAAERKAQELEHRQRSDDGRVARFQRDRDIAQRKLETLVAAAQKEGEDLRTLVASDEWQKAKADYGDDLGPVFKALERLTDQSAGVSERFQQMDAEAIEVIEQANFQMLDEKAPDWRNLLSRDDFPAWLQSQPRLYQEAFERNRERLVDPAEALELVGKYRAHVFLTENTSQPAKAPEVQLDPRRARQLDGARSVSSRTPVVADAGGGDFEAEFQRAMKARARQR